MGTASDERVEREPVAAVDDGILGAAPGVLRGGGAAPAVLARRRRGRRHVVPTVVGAVAVVSSVALWEAASRGGVVNAVYLPPPSKIAPVLVELLADGAFLGHVRASLQRIGVAFAIAVPLGVLLAILANTFKPVEWALAPVVELIRSIPPLALLPAFLLIFGIGFASPVAIIVWVAWVPVFLNTLQGMQSVDPPLLKAARSLGASRRQIAFKCVLPAAAPFIIVGLRLSLGAAFLVLLAAEMLGANSGLGFYILEASQTFKIVEMYAAIVVIGTVAWILNWIFLRSADALTPWRRASRV